MHGTPLTTGLADTKEAHATDSATLLAGLVIDAAGLPMLPSRRTVSGISGSRYYASVADARCERIPAARLDRSVVAVLKRVGLLAADWLATDLADVLRRIVVYPDALILQLNGQACIARWRAQHAGLGRATVAKVLAAMRVTLAKDENLGEIGGTLCLSTPRNSRNRCGRGRGPRGVNRVDGGARKNIN